MKDEHERKQSRCHGATGLEVARERTGECLQGLCFLESFQEAGDGALVGCAANVDFAEESQGGVEGVEPGRWAAFVPAAPV